jgi:hypothetical protein
MDAPIGGAIREVLGPDTRVVWSECLTPIERLQRLLDDREGVAPVGLIAVTDHVNAAHHRLAEATVRAAARDPRLGVCAEVWCAERDVDGEYRKGPEVLVYGGSDPVDGPFGPHYGISQEILDDIYARCRAPGLRDVQTSRVLQYCAERDLACALAHPFDGHELSLEATLDVISRGRFVETVNGGFPAASTRVLEDLIAFHNRVVAGWRLGPAAALRYPAARRLADRIVAERRLPLHAWGGSDAHSHGFARVTIRFLADDPSPTAGDLFRAMVDRPVEALLLDGTFRVCGRPGSALSVADDVVRIVLRNLWRNLPHFQGPLVFARVVRRTREIVSGELGRRARRQEALHRAVEREFDFGRILPGMVRGTRVRVRRSTPLPLTGVE